MINPPDFETHWQSHPNSETEGSNGPTKWTSGQQKLKKKTKNKKKNLHSMLRLNSCSASPSELEPTHLSVPSPGGAISFSPSGLPSFRI